MEAFILVGTSAAFNIRNNKSGMWLGSLELMVSKFKMSDDFLSFRLSNVYGEVPWLGGPIRDPCHGRSHFSVVDLCCRSWVRLLRARCDF